MVATAPTLTRVENCEPLPASLRALDPTGKGPGPVTAEPGFHTSPNKTEKAQGETLAGVVRSAPAAGTGHRPAARPGGCRPAAQDAAHAGQDARSQERPQPS